MRLQTFLLPFLSLSLVCVHSQEQAITIDLSQRHQVIDGFGAHQGDASTNQSWWQQLYYDDLGASIYRVDLTPRLKSPYSDLSYFSPWFMGSGTRSVFNLEDPANPNGPENNRVRTYTGPQDYSRTFGGRSAPIAVMGPDIERNLDYFSYPDDGAIAAGLARKEALGDFKLIGSFWSPLPWVKVSSGNRYGENWWPGPVANTPWPFVWGGNFAGGRLDDSDTPLAVFDDRSLGGSGPTSALTQFARSTAAYIRGYQRHFGVSFYAISIQNELTFEQFYNSATYPLSANYIKAVKAVRAELAKYDDLKNIRIMGPEDLLGGDAYGLWQYGGGQNTVHKNLQFLANIGADPVAADAIDFFCIHGYDSDGVSSAGANSQLWDWWANGWTNSPAPGIPARVAGFRAYRKKSWMTETSGEEGPWLHPATGFPNNGGWSIALKIHQALTTGRQSAWIYWTFTETGDNGQVTPSALTNQSSGANSPKYVAAKHFFRHIRPGAFRIGSTSSGSGEIQSSAYVHDATGALTIVLINTTAQNRRAALTISGLGATKRDFEVFSSSGNQFWQPSSLSTTNESFSVDVPAYGLVTLYGKGLVTSRQESVVAPKRPWLACIPNPAGPQASISFQLAEGARVQLSLTDSRGRKLALLIDNRPYPAGRHDIPFSTRQLSPGIYYIRLQAGSSERTEKICILP